MDLDRKKPMGNGYFKSRDVMTSKWGECKNRRNIATFGDVWWGDVMDLDSKKQMGNGYFKSRDVMTSKWGECKNRKTTAIFGMCGGVTSWTWTRRNPEEMDISRAVK